MSDKENLLEHGRTLYMQGNKEAAFSFYEELIQKKLLLPDDFVYIATLYLGNNNIMEAINCCNAAVIPRGVDSRIYFIKAYAAYLLDDFVEARETIYKYLIEDAENSEAQFLAGLIAYRMADYKIAGYFFQQVIKKNPADYKALFNMGLVSLALDQAIVAWHCFWGTVKLNPEFFIGWHILGRISREESQLNYGVQCLHKAEKITISPSGELLLDIGYTYLCLSKFSIAVQYLKKAKELLPNNIFVSAHLGEAYMGLGNIDNAIEEFFHVIADEKSAFLSRYYKALIKKIKNYNQ